MGGTSSSLVDCVQDGDTQQLKQQLLARVADVEHDEISNEELHNEVEDAIHAALSMEITTPQQYQQLQIALELLLHVAPSALQTFECNTAQWTAMHRACVTGNLSFVAFLFHRYADHIHMQRDAFGLLPVDLVPPELSLLDTSEPLENAAMPATTKALPSTDRDRIVLALQILRRLKTDAQHHALLAYTTKATSGKQTEPSNQTDGDVCLDPKAAQQPKFFISFEPSREQLSPDLVGNVHQLHSPLRIRYCLPNAEAFLHGYLQLIWRTDDEPRSEEPHYEQHILLRDCFDVDHIAPQSEDLESNQRETRRLHHEDDSDKLAGKRSVLAGSVPIDVSQLADDVVCHVLFVASDRHLMKREIVLSTEGVRLVQADPLSGLGYNAPLHEPFDPPYEYDIDSDGEVDGFEFHVAGEAFTHRSEELSGHSFESLEEFEAFVKDLRSTKQKLKGQIAPEDDSENTKDDAERRPSVLSNQDDDEVEVTVGENHGKLDKKSVEDEPIETRDNQDEGIQGEDRV